MHTSMLPFIKNPSDKETCQRSRIDYWLTSKTLEAQCRINNFSQDISKDHASITLNTNMNIDIKNDSQLK